VIDAQTAALLDAVVRRESRSLLAYTADAFPWTTARGGEALARLRRVVDGHNRAVAALGRYLARQHLVPAVHDSYPVSFTTLNFTALDHLLPRLVASERASLAELEAEAARVTDPGARAELGRLLDAKRANLAELEALQSPTPTAAAAP
jgi:hypothetical protein